MHQVNFVKNPAEEFFKNSKIKSQFARFKHIDKKHKQILKQAKALYHKNGINEIATRSWRYQNDIETPAQFNLSSLLFYRPKQWLRRIFKYHVLKNNVRKNIVTSIYDDLFAIKKIGGEKLVQENPCHKEPGSKDAYFLGKTSVNPRWLRYLYFAQRIQKENLISEGDIWMDVGPYYGGLAGILCTQYQNLITILVDFNHQLLKAHCYLKNKFPNKNFVFPQMAEKIKNYRCLKPGTFVYLPVESFNQNKDYKTDLFTNTFSLGEMTRKTFNGYIKSKAFQNCKNAYIVNRFVSSPFFEATYQNDLTILDYLKENKKKVNVDVFPIHYNLLMNKNINGRRGLRPMSSSSYFEMIFRRK